MEYVIIMEMIFAFLEKCQENRDREEIEAGLNNPGIVEAVVIHHVMKKYLREHEGLRGKKLRKRVKAETRNGMKRLKAMPPVAIAAMMDDACGRNAA